MTLSELQASGVINVRLIQNTDPEPAAGTTVEEFYGIANISDDTLSSYTFVNIDDNGMATYTV